MGTSAEAASTAAAPPDEVGLGALEQEILLVVRRLEGLRSVVHGDDDVFPLLPFRHDEGRRVLDERVASVDAKIKNSQERLSTARAAIEQRRLAEQAAREAAEQAAREAAEKAAREAAERAAREAAEVAAREVAAREAAARAARDAAAAEEAQRARDAARRKSSSSGGSSSGGSTASSGGYDGYTGCRAYGKGGTSIDEKGRRYTKISC